MAQQARVGSIDALVAFKTSLIKFAEAVNVSLGDADSEIGRTTTWVEHEQASYWQGQVRQRQETVTRAKDAVRQKKLYKNFDGTTPSAVDEEKALQIALRRLQEAEQKMLAVKHWARRLDREATLYKGQAARLAGAIAGDVPRAVAKLTNMIMALERYMALRPEYGAGAAGEALAPSQFAEAMASMARAEGPEAPNADESTTTIKGPTPAEKTVARQYEDDARRWRPGVVSDADQQRLGTLRFIPAPFENGDRVFIAADSLNAPKLRFERTEPMGEGDSGWLIMPAHVPAPTGFRWITVANLLSARPDLEPLLALPIGFAVIIDAEGVAAVFDDQGAELWSGPATASQGGE